MRIQYIFHSSRPKRMIPNANLPSNFNRSPSNDLDIGSTANGTKIILNNNTVTLITPKKQSKITGKLVRVTPNKSVEYQIDYFAGGRLIINANNTAELTQYGSGFPIISRDHGILKQFS